jgi:hypothetical protein
VLGGTTIKFIDELLDAWQRSRDGKHGLHCILYDVQQAYDSVQRDVKARRALRRLRMPESFVALVSDSLTDLRSCVRTVCRHTRWLA